MILEQTFDLACDVHRTGVNGQVCLNVYERLGCTAGYRVTRADVRSESLMAFCDHHWRWARCWLPAVTSTQRYLSS